MKGFTYILESDGVQLKHISGDVIEIDKYKLERRGRLTIVVITDRQGKKHEIARFKIDESNFSLGDVEGKPTGGGGGRKKHEKPTAKVSVSKLIDAGNDVIIQLTVPRSFALSLLGPGEKTVKLSTTLAVLDVQT